MPKKALIILLLIAALLSWDAALAADASTRPATPPNILLLIADDLGYGDCSAYPTHAADISTPNIDRIGQNGVRFSAGYVTAPVCSPSRTGLISGRYQQRFDSAAGWRTTLPHSATTIAEHLHAAGYATMMIGKNDFGQHLPSKQDRRYPMNHGYDHHLGFETHAHDYFLLTRDIEQRATDPHGESPNVGPLDFDRDVKEFASGYTTDIFTDAGISFIRDNATKRPFFLVVAYNAVHDLVEQVPPKYLERYHVAPIPRYEPAMGSYKDYYQTYNHLGKVSETDMRRFYLANLACLDDNVARLLETLDQLKMTHNTMIVFMSDNGGAPASGGNNQPLRASKYTTYEGGLRVPFIISWPAKIKAKETIDEPVSSLDLLPTFAAAAGASPTGASIDGTNLLPRLTSDAPSTDLANRVLYWKFQKQWAIRRGDWKLVRANPVPNHPGGNDSWIKGGPRSSEPQLFNLKDDVAEQHDLAANHPDLMNELQTLYQKWEATHGELSETSSAPTTR